MTTTTVYSDVADGWIICIDGDYATCVAGAFDSLFTTSTEGYTGQLPGYEAHESFVGFDTASIPDTDSVTTAVLSLWGQTDSSDVDYVVEARAYDWGTTVTSADWRTPAQLGSATLLATYDTVGWSLSAYNVFTSAAGMAGAINKTGFTRMVLASDQTRLSSDPAGSQELTSHWMGDQSGTANDPKLVITHTAGGVSATATPSVAALVLTQPAVTAKAGSTSTPARAQLVLAAPAVTAGVSGTRTPAATALVLTAPAVSKSAGSAPTPAQAALVLTVPAPTLSAGSTKTVAVAALTIAVPAVSAGASHSRTPAVAVFTLAVPAPTERADAFRIPATAAFTLSVPPPSLVSTSTVSINLATFDIVMTITGATVPPFRVINLPTFDIPITIYGPEAIMTLKNTFDIVMAQTPATVTAISQPNQVIVAVTLQPFNILFGLNNVTPATQVADPTHAVPLPDVFYSTTIPPDIIKAAAVGPITKITTRLEIQNSNGSLYMSDFDIESGSITVSLDRDERRTIDIALHDPDNLIDHHPGGLWYDKILVPYRGIIYKNHVWEAPLGRFYIDKISEPDFPHIVSITGRDQAKQLLANKLPWAITFTAGEAPEDVIRVIATNADPSITRLNLEVTGKTLGRDYTFERSTSRWEIISKIAEAFSMEVFFDTNGYLILRTFRDPTLTPSIWTFQTGLRVGNLARFTKSGDDSRLFNDIVVIGQSTAQLPVVGQAENNLAGSGSSIDLIGRRTYPYESNFVSTQSQADDLAVTLLQVMSLESYEMSFDALVASWLEVGEVVDIIDPEPWTGQPTRFLLTDLSLPIGLGSMSGTGKRVQLVR